MDIDLFQAILLGLLAVGLIVLIALLMTLGGIRKALERGGPTAGAAAPSPASAEPERVEPAPAAAATAVTPAVQETPAQETAAPAPTATATTPAAAAPAPAAEDSQAATIRAVLSQHGVDAASQTPTPAAQAPAATEPASVVAKHIDTDEPEEEPFQRDGRWWFKRGGELLVYNEGTAQWEAGERPAHWPAAGSASTSAIPVATTTAAASTAATSPQPAVTGAGTGWKCPSCGAINGSTAASCRMCFTARP